MKKYAFNNVRQLEESQFDLNLTIIPRKLIYRVRIDLDEFWEDTPSSLNKQLYYYLRRYLFVDLGYNNYQTYILWLFNEAYYLTTMIMMDKNADKRIKTYKNAAAENYPYPDFVKDTCKRLVLAMVYIFLGKSARREVKTSTIRRSLRTYANEFPALLEETGGLNGPSDSVFTPVALTKTLLLDVEWRQLTDDFDVKCIECFVDTLGNKFEEKRWLIESIYWSFLNCGNIYSIRYEVDALIYELYEKYEGNKNTLFNLSSNWNEGNEICMKNLLESEWKTEKKNLLSQIKTLNNRIMEMEAKHNEEIANILINFTKKEEDVLKEQSSDAKTRKALEEYKKQDEMSKNQISQMEQEIKMLRDKLGNKTIPLSSLAEGIKTFANFKGLSEGKELLMSLTYILKKEHAWTDNVESLENFFIEAEKENKKDSTIKIEKADQVNAIYGKDATIKKE